MELEIEITALSRGGSGIGRDAEGRVIFVPFSCPGDRLRVQIVQEHKRFADGKILEILSPSPQRVLPKCPVFQRCGGCEWQHLPYSLQWETKSSGVYHALERVGVSCENIPRKEFPADQIWEYRNRIQVRGFRDKLGFYERKSKNIIPIDRCDIARPELNAFLSDVKSDGEKRVREYKAELEVFPSGVVTVSWNSSHSAQGFRQVHDDQNEKLQNWVRDSLPIGASGFGAAGYGESSSLGEGKPLSSAGGAILFDLYGGSGNLSLGLRDRYSHIHCVDVGGGPNFSGSSNLTDAIDEVFTFHRSPVGLWLQRNRKDFVSSSPIDVILDPPREGMGEDIGVIVETLKALPVRTILSIGCETDSWARGIHRLQKAGFHLTQVGALDFFPHTHHVESLAKFERHSTTH